MIFFFFGFLFSNGEVSELNPAKMYSWRIASFIPVVDTKQIVMNRNCFEYRKIQHITVKVK